MDRNDPAYARPGLQRFADFALIGLRVAAGAYSLYFAVGLLLWWVHVFRMRLDFRGQSALVFPWIFLPLFASAGILAGFAIWGTRRPDRMGVLGQGAMAIQGLYAICEIALDGAVNRQDGYLLATRILAASMLCLVVSSAWRHASNGYQYPWLPILRMILSEIPSVMAIFMGSSAIEGWQNIRHNKLQGWAMITTPVIAVAGVIAVALTIALVWLAWRIQSRPLPQRITRNFPAHWTP